MSGETVRGLLVVVGGTAGLASVLGVVLYAREIAARAVRLGRALHILAPPLPPPVGLPLERIARDLRRLRPEARSRRATTYAKLRGLVAAYDDVLLDACRALQVPTTLDSMPDGIERESERLRVEHALEQAGLRIDPPA